MSRIRHPRAALLGVLILSSVIVIVYAARFAGARSSAVTAQSAQRWSHSNGGYNVAALSDGTIVTAGDHVPAQRIRPVDGQVLSNNFPVPDNARRLGRQGPRPDYLIGGYQDRRAVRGDGPVAGMDRARLAATARACRPPLTTPRAAYITQNNTLSVSS